MRQPFVLFYRHGPAWEAGKSVYQQALQEHLAYMKSLVRSGDVVLGGPFADDCGGMVVVKADNLEQARGIMAADPAVRASIMVAEAHPWHLMAGAL